MTTDPTPASHWILQDRPLSWMILALQVDAESLGRWRTLNGGEPADCGTLAIIRQLGFEHTPHPTGALDELRFIVRFTLACLAHSTNSLCQTAIIQQSYRRRPT